MVGCELDTQREGLIHFINGWPLKVRSINVIEMIEIICFLGNYYSAYKEPVEGVCILILLLKVLKHIETQ